MADLIESARGVLSLSERRLEAAANNVANLMTPGFKAERLYSDVSADADLRAPETLMTRRLDLSQGRLTRTGNPLDLAINGPGLFRLKGPDGSIAYSRSGQFRLADGGRVVNAQGFALQAGDGDLVVPDAAVTVAADGTVLDGEKPVAKIGLYQLQAGVTPTALGGSLVIAPEEAIDEVATPQLVQGTIEGSNVTLADEMVSMMDALRQAEGGAHLVQAYDDLIGKAISTLGQGAR
jgi:flagellar basal-body rod protein FlgF